MRSATLATAGLAALLVLASCGGDDDAEATQPTDSAASTTRLPPTRHRPPVSM